MVYTLIDHRNDAISCSKLGSETTRLAPESDKSWPGDEDAAPLQPHGLLPRSPAIGSWPIRAGGIIVKYPCATHVIYEMIYITRLVT